MMLGAGYRGAPVHIEQPPSKLQRLWRWFAALPVLRKLHLALALHMSVVITIASPRLGLIAVPVCALACVLYLRIVDKRSPS